MEIPNREPFAVRFWRCIEMKNLAIKAENLKKSYGELEAVRGISFEVEEGIIFGMLGPNGAGKTTTIETIVGLISRDGGLLSLFGLDPDKESDEIKKIIGVQLQSPALFPRLTVTEILALFASFYPEPMRVADVVSMIGLDEKEKTQVANLSGGQRHRLAVGLAMVSNGRVIFLDEPTTGLDPQARRYLWEVILSLKKAGKTVFLTTHYMDEAERLCDELLIIDHGRVIAKGSPKKLIKENFQETAIEFTDPGFLEEDKEELKGIGLAERITFDNEEKHIILYSNKVPESIKALMDFAEKKEKIIEDITVRQACLEDVFLKLTGRGIRE
ncbi:MAG: ABC transporter ATP-binding protein [Bacillota bacterium]